MWMKIYFTYEKMSTKTRFENEAWGNSEMAYFPPSLWGETHSRQDPFVWKMLNSNCSYLKLHFHGKVWTKQSWATRNSKERTSSYLVERRWCRVNPKCRDAKQLSALKIWCNINYLMKRNFPVCGHQCRSEWKFKIRNVLRGNEKARV